MIRKLGLAIIATTIAVASELVLLAPDVIYAAGPADS